MLKDYCMSFHSHHGVCFSLQFHMALPSITVLYARSKYKDDKFQN